MPVKHGVYAALYLIYFNKASYNRSGGSATKNDSHKGNLMGTGYKY